MKDPRSMKVSRREEVNFISYCVCRVIQGNKDYINQEDVVV